MPTGSSASGSEAAGGGVVIADVLHTKLATGADAGLSGHRAD